MSPVGTIDKVLDHEPIFEASGCWPVGKVRLPPVESKDSRITAFDVQLLIES
jgi:hypothetical protein